MFKYRFHSGQIALLLIAFFLSTQYSLGVVCDTKTKRNPRKAGRQTKLEIPETNEPTRFELTVYRCKTNGENSGPLDFAALDSSAKSSRSLQSALAELGDTEVIALLDQSVELSERRFSTSVGASVPIVKGKSVSSNGKTSASINYDHAGVVIDLSGKWSSEDSGAAAIQIEIDISDVTPSKIEYDDGVYAPVMYRLKLPFAGTIESGKPYLTTAFGAQSDSNRPTVYVARLCFTRASNVQGANSDKEPVEKTVAKEPEIENKKVTKEESPEDRIRSVIHRIRKENLEQRKEARLRDKKVSSVNRTFSANSSLRQGLTRYFEIYNKYPERLFELIDPKAPEHWITERDSLDIADPDNFIDPWGNQYGYVTYATPEDGYKLHYRLWSNGPDGKHSTDDDIEVEN